MLTLFLTFDLTLFGAFTRLTDSGLGCPDWPGCYGNASPVGARHDIALAQAAQPTGPVTHGKAWVEMVHRYLATGVGVLILVLAIATWVARRRQRRPRRQRRASPLSPWWPAATLVWVCLQGAFGALTVTMKLFPAIVTLHLLGGVVLLALLCIQAVRYQQAPRERAPTPLPPALRGAAGRHDRAAAGLQIALGGWVSTNYAVLACTSFPTCQGSWWPPMDFAQGFELWRQLGVTADGAPIDFAALTAIHYVHRLMAYVVFVALGACWPGACARVPALRAAGALAGRPGRCCNWHRPGATCCSAGRSLAAVLHTGGAAALVVVLTWALCESRRAPSRGRAPRARARASRPVRMSARRSPCRTAARQRAAPVLCADQAARGAAHRLLRPDRHGAGRARRARRWPTCSMARSPASASGWWPAPPPPSTAWSRRASTPR